MSVPRHCFVAAPATWAYWQHLAFLNIKILHIHRNRIILVRRVWFKICQLVQSRSLMSGYCSMHFLQLLLTHVNGVFNRRNAIYAIQNNNNFLHVSSGATRYEKLLEIRQQGTYGKQHITSRMFT